MFVLLTLYSRVEATSEENEAEKMKQKRRQVSAIKTIVYVSGVYFLMYYPMALMRLLMFLAGMTPEDLELRRFPAMTILARFNTIAMGATNPSVNPIMYLLNRKALKKCAMEMMSRLRCCKSTVDDDLA